MRTTKHITLTDAERFKKQLLKWAQQFEEVVWLDSNAPDNPGNRQNSAFDTVLAVDALTSVKTDWMGGFEKLEEYRSATKDWLFGYLTYDLKNDVENLSSSNYDGLQFPDLYFIQPKKLFFFRGNVLEMKYLNMVSDEMDDDLTEIQGFTESGDLNAECVKPEIKLRTSKDAYLEKARKMLGYIQRGDIYEANFCQEFYMENTEIDPLRIFEKLNDISRAPFSTFMKWEKYYLLSASPERYLRKDGSRVLSQPIKGTARRSPDSEEDRQLAEALANNLKERSENIMITDLVRNDLSRTAVKGSVKVEELCGLYTFRQVHQLISTVTAEITEGTTPVEVIRSTFPMGSMTGAPKVSAMAIIEELEDTKRGLYSGTAGYFTPEDDFDFNVVIRSILYNSERKYVSFSVGSAITAASVPEQEYEECLVKAKAMRQVLEE